MRLDHPLPLNCIFQACNLCMQHAYRRVHKMILLLLEQPFSSYFNCCIFILICTRGNVTITSNLFFIHIKFIKDIPK